MTISAPPAPAATFTTCLTLFGSDYSEYSDYSDYSRSRKKINEIYFVFYSLIRTFVHRNQIFTHHEIHYPLPSEAALRGTRFHPPLGWGGSNEGDIAHRRTHEEPIDRR